MRNGSISFCFVVFVVSEENKGFKLGNYLGYSQKGVVESVSLGKDPWV